MSYSDLIGVSSSFWIPRSSRGMTTLRYSIAVIIMKCGAKSMHGLITRDMREENIPAVVKIERISFSTPYSEQFFLDQIYKKYALSKVAVFDDRIIGYVCADYHLHESHILTLAVHPDFRRRRVATVLMDEAISKLKEKGCVFVYLKVRASNAGARKFYELLGFKIESIRKKYYDFPEEDALLMMARL